MGVQPGPPASSSPRGSCGRRAGPRRVPRSRRGRRPRREPRSLRRRGGMDTGRDPRRRRSADHARALGGPGGRRGRLGEKGSGNEEDRNRDEQVLCGASCPRPWKTRANHRPRRRISDRPLRSAVPTSGPPLCSTVSLCASTRYRIRPSVGAFAAFERPRYAHEFRFERVAGRMDHRIAVAAHVHERKVRRQARIRALGLRHISALLILEARFHSVPKQHVDRWLRPCVRGALREEQRPHRVILREAVFIRFHHTQRREGAGDECDSDRLEFLWRQRLCRQSRPARSTTEGKFADSSRPYDAFFIAGAARAIGFVSAKRKESSSVRSSICFGIGVEPRECPAFVS